jgi:hypothetical protein
MEELVLNYTFENKIKFCFNEGRQEKYLLPHITALLCHTFVSSPPFISCICKV